MFPLQLQYIAAFPLLYTGDCEFLGISPKDEIYVEEMYDDWFAQHKISMSGKILESVDEHYGATKTAHPLPLPPDIIKPAPAQKSRSLNYRGARYRGMREAERIRDLAQEIPVLEKTKLIERLKLDITPMMLLGIAESAVLAEAELIPSQLLIVCRRLRLAYALSETLRDQDNQPYNYDTIKLFITHLYNCQTDEAPPLSQTLSGFAGVSLRRPTDCIIANSHLFIADGGGDGHNSAIHIWKVRHEH